jgi:signal transduction histidine kinase
MQGVTDLRNKQTQIIPYDPYTMVHEFFDVYIKIDNKWTFYQKFRISSLLQKKSESWKVLHQHGSYPDSKTQQGEAFAFDAMKNENLKLQNAIRERTIELEQKNRELAIEAALERVRAGSMAMHKSEELGDISFELVKQIQSLGVEVWHCGFNIYDEDQDNATEWGSNAAGTFPKYKTPRIGIFKKYYEIGKTGKALHIEVIGEDKCADHYEWLCTLPGVGEQLLKLKESGVPFPKSQIDHVAFFKYGYLLFITYEPAPDSNDIFIRFAKEFEQTYTRFLDLQRAEAQSRESQIELGLERVRARAMAMKESGELSDLVATLLHELTRLDFSLNFCIINIINEPDSSNTVWAANPEEGKAPESYYMRFEDFPFHHAMMREWKAQTPKFVYVMEGEEKKIYDDYLFTQTEFRRFPEEVKIASRALDKWVATFVFSQFGGLQTVGTEAMSDESIDILYRFGKVFDLTYTRFNDLLLAEAQAIKAKENIKAIQTAKSNAEKALAELKSVQEQLIQQEKLASLGQLTAGIAHEIKNPLNFVNNFSEVSIELIEEAFDELAKVKMQQTEAQLEAVKEIEAILKDIGANLRKIHEHGSRADRIVKSMLQHSRGGSGKKEATNLNSLVKEYVNLSYHGMRAAKDAINVDIKLDLDESIGDVYLIADDFSRVILNLCNNAFDAMWEKAIQNSKLKIEDYSPQLSVRTKSEKDSVIIEIEDNGPGIPDAIKDKILQPFFTTKKGTQGTGLGLSITNDILKAHGGKIDVNSSKNGTIMIIKVNNLTQPKSYERHSDN